MKLFLLLNALCNKRFRIKIRQTVLLFKTPHEDELNQLKHIAPISPIPITRDVVKESFKEIPLPEVPKAQSPPPPVIEKSKPSFALRRKLFRRGLLLHALMKRKDCIA